MANTNTATSLPLNLGNFLKIARKKRNIHQSTLSKNLKVQQPYISMIETGKRRPSFELLKEIGQQFDVPEYALAFLMVDQDDIKKKKSCEKEAFAMAKQGIDKIILHLL